MSPANAGGMHEDKSHWRKPRVLPPVWFLIALVLIGVAHRYFPVVDFIASPWRWFGALPVAIGLAMVLISAGSFAKAGTPVVPFRRSSSLVDTGFYRYTRNPMYLGMALVLGGVAMMTGVLTAWLPVPLFVLIIQRNFIEGEERFLESIFGDEYRDYCRRVRRWL